MKHKEDQKNKRLKVIPNKLFHKLWDAAQTGDKGSYIKRFTFPSSPDIINFYKDFGMSPNSTYKMLEQIHYLANLSFKEILELTGKRKAHISDIFCIPIRTIEEWYSGNNRCPSYIRLAILNNYYKVDLGKRIITEAEKERRDNRPNTYASREVQEKYKRRIESEEKLDGKLNQIDSITSKYNHDPKKDIKNILNETDYLKDIIYKRKK